MTVQRASSPVLGMARPRPFPSMKPKKTNMPVATPTRETTVIIVEDDAGIRESLTDYLDESPDCRCLAAFPNAEAALEPIGRAQPDVVIMDINLPGMSGIEATRELKRRHPELRILMLTVYEEGKALFESLKAGACGYLLKRTAPEKIIEAIHDAKAGGVPLNPQMAAKVAQFFRQASPLEAELGTLTQRERETLELLAEGYLYKEIAHRMGVSTGTVHQFIKHIYEKLHVHSRTEAVLKYLGTNPASRR